ncbi:MAG: hypothetical protein FJ056_05280 [Cyanobacteria bacterium M_surface_10_m2_179]|nr:hypothetical protein [Cyanobacteria bacterium M_surface_10_m2_179]
MKLSSITTSPAIAQQDFTELTQTATQQERSHLLSLNQQEALMLFSLMQAALRHEPTRRTLLSQGDYKQFHRQLSHSLASGLAAS